MSKMTDIDRYNRSANMYSRNVIDIMPVIAKWIEQRRYNTEIYLNNPDPSAKDNAFYLINVCNAEIKSILAIVEPNLSTNQ